MIKLAQIGFMIGVAILLCLVVWNYPLISLTIACLGILWLASAIKNGRPLWM